MLSHDDQYFCQFIGDVPFNILRRLTELDYRKALVAAIAARTYFEFGSDYRWVLGVPGIAKILPHTVFQCIPAKRFDDLVPATFLSVRFKYDYQQ